MNRFTVKTRFRDDAKTWSLDYVNPEGRRRRIQVGSEEEARRLAVRFTDWLIQGKDPEREIDRAHRKETARNVTLREFFPRFMERHGNLQSANAQRLYRTLFGNISRCPQLAEEPIGEISRVTLRDYMQLRMQKDKVTAGTVNREASLIRNMLNRAVEWETIDRNPIQGFRMLKEAGKRKVRVTLQQLQELIVKLPEPVGNLVEFAVYTGFRKENILDLKIEQIRFHDLTPTAEVDLVVKGGKFETFPIAPAAVETLKRAMGERKSGHVFLNPRTGKRYSCVHKSFDRAVVKMGLKVDGTKMRFHDLRHLFANLLRSAGVSLDDIRDLMGHADRAMTDRYTTIDRNVVGKKLAQMPVLREKKVQQA